MKRTSSFLLIGLGLLLVASVPINALAGEGRDKVKLQLRNTGEDEDARGKLDFRASDRRDRFRMKLRLKDLDVGDYDVLLDGVSVTTVAVVPDNDGTGTRGKLKLRGSMTDMPFDPRGAALTVERGGVVYLTGSVPGSGESARLRIEHEIDLDNVGSSQPRARAEAEFRSRDGQERFRVRLRRAEPGNYELLVGGSSVGMFEVLGDGEGTIKFDTVPHDGPTDWRLLTFDPLGESLEVVSGGETLLAGELPARP